MKTKSPVNGPGATPIAIPTNSGGNLLKEARDVAQLRSVDAKALEAYADKFCGGVMSRKRIVDGQVYSPVTMVQVDLGVLQKSSASPVRKGGRAQFAGEVKKDLTGAAQALAEIWKDGLVTEDEIKPMRAALAKLDRVLDMSDSGVLDMMGADVKPAVDTAFSNLRKLADAVRTQLKAYDEQLNLRDRGALTEKLHALNPVYATVTGKVDLASSERYQPGDLIVVSPPSSGVQFGVVTGRSDKGLEVEVLDHQAKVSTRTLDDASVRALNPFKLGDHFNLDGQEVWVSPSKSDGVMLVSRPEGSIQMEMTPASKSGDLHNAVRSAFLQVPSAPTQMTAPPSDRQVLARGATSPTAQTMNLSEHVEGAVMSDVAPGGTQNLDAAILATIKGKKGEVVVAGVSDESSAGSGVVSEAVIDGFDNAARQIANGKDPAKALKGAIAQAESFGNTKDGVATMCGAVITNQAAKGQPAQLQANVVSIGSSIALHFSDRMHLLNRTKEHTTGARMMEATGDVNARPGLGHQLTRGIGYGKTLPDDVEQWPVQSGDYLVFLTAGAAHANQNAQQAARTTDKPFTAYHTDVTALHIGSILEDAGSAEEAVEMIANYARNQMASADGRAGDLTVNVVKVR